MADFASTLVVDQAVLGVERLFEIEGAQWTTWNDFQKLLVRHSVDARLIADLLGKDQLFSKSAHDVETVNRFLRENEFGDVQLRDHGTGPLFGLIQSAETVTGNGVVMPLVSMEQSVKVDISDLVGMNSGSTQITEAIAAAKFSLSQRSVKFEMAAAVSAKRMAMERGVIQKGDFVVDGPLHFALVKRQLPTMPLMPLAVGTIQPEEFSNSKELE